jgi:hypothetical protein
MMVPPLLLVEAPGVLVGIVNAALIGHLIGQRGAVVRLLQKLDEQIPTTQHSTGSANSASTKAFSVNLPEHWFERMRSKIANVDKRKLIASDFLRRLRLRAGKGKRVARPHLESMLSLNRQVRNQVAIWTQITIPRTSQKRARTIPILLENGQGPT